MKKLSKNEENRILDTVNAVMGKCAKGEDPSQAVAAMSVQQNLSTEEASRVCEAVNKIASISYLSTHPADRDATFPLADSEEVAQLMRDTRKVAADPFKFRRTVNEGLHTMTVEEMHAKIALDPEMRKQLPAVDPRYDYSAGWERLQACTQSLKLASDEARLENMKLEMELADLAKAFDTMRKEAAEDAARYAVQYYGNDGRQFLNALENVGVEIPEFIDRPCMKTSSDVEKRIDSFMRHTDNYLALKYATEFFYTAKEAASGAYPAALNEVNAAFVKRYNAWVNKRNKSGKTSTLLPTITVADVTPDFLASHPNNKKWYDEEAQKIFDRDKPILDIIEQQDKIQQRSMFDPILDEQEKRQKAYEKEQRDKFDRSYDQIKGWVGGTSAVSSGTSDFLTGLVDGAVGNTKATLQNAVAMLQKADALRQALEPPQLSGNKYSEPLSLKATKYLDNLDLHDAFAKAYLSDPYLRQYPPEEVAEAFNIVHEVAPDLISKNASPHVVSALLRKYLASNNQIDPLEIKDLTTTEKERKETELKQRQIESYKNNKPNQGK